MNLLEFDLLCIFHTKLCFKESNQSVEDVEELFLDFRLTVSAIQHCQVRRKTTHVYSNVLPDQVFHFFLFWMAVPRHEQIYFTFASISLLFLISFHNKNVLFCFENQKNESISS